MPNMLHTTYTNYIQMIPNFYMAMLCAIKSKHILVFGIGIIIDFSFYNYYKIYA